MALSENEKQIRAQQKVIDSLVYDDKLSEQIHKELRAQYPNIKTTILQNTYQHQDTINNKIWIGVISAKPILNEKEKTKIFNWLKIRMTAENLELFFR